jgi:hypothetical protein
MWLLRHSILLTGPLFLLAACMRSRTVRKPVTTSISDIIALIITTQLSDKQLLRFDYESFDSSYTAI